MTKCNFEQYLFFLAIVLAGCKDIIVSPSGPVDFIDISIDKSSYAPGESVNFKIDQNTVGPITVNVKWKNVIVASSDITGDSWTWNPPRDDFRGYMAEFSSSSNGEKHIIGTIGFDVCSDWTVFPRYGFLSNFGAITSKSIDSVVESLRRFHINGVQFYNWVDKPHKPLAGTVNNPTETWSNIVNRPIYKSTIQNYIARLHQSGIKAMSNNLIYGALENASSDGVNENWYLYTTYQHTQKLFYDSTGFWKSPIYILDHGNPNWVQFLNARNADVYSIYNFDGFQADQLNGIDEGFDYHGLHLHMFDYFEYFLQTIYWANPLKNLLFREIRKYDLSGTFANRYVDFLYRDIPLSTTLFVDLDDRVVPNSIVDPAEKKVVVSAYLNRNLYGHSPFFNTPSVLLADAVIFAFGGSHMELGEHMANQIYLPDNTLKMKSDLVSNLHSYYDFLVAYENVLREGIDFNSPGITSTDHKIILQEWPPQQGAVAFIGKEVNNSEVVHFINFENASTLAFRDPDGIQNEPPVIENFEVQMTLLDPVKKIWFASPDFEGGASREIDFFQHGLEFTFTVPYLKYWSMIVVEY